MVVSMAQWRDAGLRTRGFLLNPDQSSAPWAVTVLPSVWCGYTLGLFAQHLAERATTSPPLWCFGLCIECRHDHTDVRSLCFQCLQLLVNFIDMKLQNDWVLSSCLRCPLLSWSFTQLWIQWQSHIYLTFLLLFLIVIIFITMKKN